MARLNRRSVLAGIGCITSIGYRHSKAALFRWRPGASSRPPPNVNLKSIQTTGSMAATSNQLTVGGSLPSGRLTRSPANPIINNTESYESNRASCRAIVVMGTNNYRMWYEALDDDQTDRIAYATSTDGITWTKYGIVMAPSQAWENSEISPDSVLYENGLFKMWYHGGAQWIGGVYTARESIGYATSSDGITWTNYAGNPILSLGASGTWDSGNVAAGPVFNLSAMGLGTGYRMYYNGEPPTPANHRGLGMATSPDGMAWTKYSGNPVIPYGFGANSNYDGWQGAIIYQDGFWHIWYSLIDQSAGLNYAYSRDGITWIDPGDVNPVLTRPTDPSLPDYQQVGANVTGYFDPQTNAYRILYDGYNSNYRGALFHGICMATIARPAVPLAPW
jgi:hypothetical protein